MNLGNDSKKLYSIIHREVRENWNPLGIPNLPYDEYDDYIDTICNLLRNTPTHKALFELLWTIETETMGMSGDKEKTENFTCRLICIAEEYKNVR